MKSFDIAKENRLYRQEYEILSNVPENLENPLFVHLFSSFHPTTIFEFSINFSPCWDPKGKVFTLPSSTNWLCKTFLETLVLRVKGELCTACYTQARYDRRSLGSKEFKNSPAAFWAAQSGLVWSSPVWLQTGQPGFSTTSDHQTEFSAPTFEGEEDASDVTHLAIAHLSSWCVFSAWTSWLMRLFVSACILILEPSPRPCDKYVAQASLWLPSDLCARWTSLT